MSLKRVKRSEIGILPGLCPPQDPVFNDLLEGAVAGRVPVYYGEVPFGLIRPFDPDYAPSRHPVGQMAIQDTFRRWVQGDFQRVWVYQEEQHFVLSDDYITWEAAKQGRPDFLPCWVLGNPSHTSIENVQGPIEPTEIARLLGLDS